MSTAAGRVAQRAPARKPAGRTQRAPVKKPSPRAGVAAKRIAVQRSTVVFVVVTGAVVVAIMLGLVAVNALLAQTSFRIGDLQTRIGRLTQSYEQRRMQAAQVSSPAHLAKVAARLGLVVPQSGIIILTPPPASTAHSSGKAVGGTP